MHIKLTCFLKPDLDTMVAGALLGAQPAALFALRDTAPEWLLADRHILCLECGGSGRTAEGNFDHHGAQHLPCAAEQAWYAVGTPQACKALVVYTAAIDTGQPQPSAPASCWSLSAVVSGMRLCTPTPCAQFTAGLELVRTVLRRSLAPEDISWLLARDARAAAYARVKLYAQKALAALAPQAVTVRATPCKIMALSTTLPGVHGLLRQLGADISLAWNPQRRQWTVAAAHGFEVHIRALLSLLEAREPGWGGPAGGGIIGSPRSGSRLTLNDIAACLRRVFPARGRTKAKQS